MSYFLACSNYNMVTSNHVAYRSELHFTPTAHSRTFLFPAPISDQFTFHNMSETEPS